MRRKGVLYIEIAETIKQSIQNNVYPVGTMLPTENELEEKFSVSKITIRKAVEVLALQGYVEKKSGKGTTVISNRLFNNLSKGQSFSSVLATKGLQVKKEIVSIEQKKLKKADSLYPYFKQGTTLVQRIYLLDGAPYIFFEHYLPASVFKSMKAQINDKSLYSILAEEGFLVDRFEDQFFVHRLTTEEQNRLETEESHGMIRERKSFNHEGEVIEVAISTYNTQKHPYEIHFEI